MLDEFTPASSRGQYRGSFQQLADARRVLKVTNSLQTAPVLAAAERAELERIRALAIRCIEAATAELIDTLDVLHDADMETNGDDLDGDHAEDEAGSELYVSREGGPGCPIADPDVGVDDERHDPEEGV